MTLGHLIVYAFVAVIIGLAIRRYRIWKNEDFEEREN
jgi:hypothetical protein